MPVHQYCIHVASSFGVRYPERPKHCILYMAPAVAFGVVMRMQRHVES
jgi:hypothetical protein